jgi:hypothetical protein
MAGGTGVKEGSGVGVSGAAVDVGSPDGTVSVGTGVLVMVEVGGIVDVAGAVQVGCGAGSVDSGWGEGAKLVTYSVMTATHTVPITPMIDAMMVESILLLLLDIAFPIL